MRTREEDSSFGKKGMRDDSRKKVLGEKREREFQRQSLARVRRIRDFAIVFGRGIPGRIRDKSIVGAGK